MEATTSSNYGDNVRNPNKTVTNKKCLRPKKKRRTKVMQTSQREKHLLGCRKYTRLYSTLHCNDVVVVGGASIGGAHLKSTRHAGNRRYLAILQKYRNVFSQTKGFEKRSVVDLVVNEVRMSNPPGRFIDQRFGFEQWLEMEEKSVIRMIQNGLRLLGASPSPKPMESSSKVAVVKRFPKKKLSTRKIRAKATASIVAATKLAAQLHDTGPSAKTNAVAFPIPSVPKSEPITNFLLLPCLEEQRAKLSDYNQLLLDGMELFQANEIDVAKGRGRVKVGQIGIRCRYCAKEQKRTPASVAFPGTTTGMEFNAFGMANKHFIECGTKTACPCIPQELRNRLQQVKKLSIRQTKERGGSGIQGYFNQMVLVCGISSNTRGGLKLKTHNDAPVKKEKVQAPTLETDVHRTLSTSPPKVADSSMEREPFSSLLQKNSTVAKNEEEPEHPGNGVITHSVPRPQQQAVYSSATMKEEQILLNDCHIVVSRRNIGTVDTKASDNKVSKEGNKNDPVDTDDDDDDDDGDKICVWV